MEPVTNNGTELSVSYETEFTRKLKFGLFVALEPPSLICSFILLYFLVVNPTLRRFRPYHSLFALLILSVLTNTFDGLRMIDFLHQGIVLPQTKISCLIWQWYDYIFYGHSNVLLFWASAERYLLIFHGNMFATTRQRLYFHYLPYLGITVYLVIFYTSVIFFTPCDAFDFTSILCGAPCYTIQGFIALYDNIVHNWLPVALNIILNIVLIIRVYYKNPVGLQQNNQRRKHRKMVFQLLLISSLHLIGVLPFAVVVFVQVSTNAPDFGASIQIVYFYYLFYLHALLQPFVCIGCLPEVMKEIKKSWVKLTRRNARVIPTNPVRPLD